MSPWRRWLWPFEADTDEGGVTGDPFVDAYLGYHAAGTLAVVAACCSLWARGFEAVDVEASAPVRMALTPPVLRQLGYRLAVEGNYVAAIEADMGGLRLTECASYDVFGRGRWRYRLDIPQPSGSRTLTLPEEAVVHCRLPSGAAAPWRSQSPLQAASATAALAKAIEESLRGDFAGPTGTIVFAAEGDKDGGGELKAELEALRGGVHLASAGRNSWRNAGGSTGVANSAPGSERLGPRPPEALPVVRRHVEESLSMAYGVPGELLVGGAAGSQREAWRRFLHGTLAPVGRSVEAELSAKLDSPVALNFDRLFASDLAGRSRAVGQLVTAGVELDRALEIAGMGAE